MISRGALIFWNRNSKVLCKYRCRYCSSAIIFFRISQWMFLYHGQPATFGHYTHAGEPIQTFHYAQYRCVWMKFRSALRISR
jgi:hypothetical protein